MKNSFKRQIPYLVVLAAMIFLSVYESVQASNTIWKDTAASRVAVNQRNGDVRIYQYLISSATATWYSDMIPVAGASHATLTIFEDDGTDPTDWAGTVGTGDFYLRGTVSGMAGGLMAAGETASATNALQTIPYIYGPMVTSLAGTYIQGATPIDVYGRTFYDLGSLGGLTHIQAYCTTNNVANVVQISLW